MGLDRGAFGHTQPFPEIADTFSGKLIVAAGAACLWEDLEKGRWSPECAVLTVNDITMHFPGPVAHAYSNDARWLPKWVEARRELLLKRHGPIGHVHSNHRGVQWEWPWPGHGTSLLGGVYTGLALGYSQIIICGGPLDDSPHYFEPPWMKTNFSREVGDRNGKMRYWTRAKDEIFGGRVTSVSGRTKELLGEPS